MNVTSLSVIVCTFNREKHLARCLESLANQTLQFNLFEILVIDNCSTDQTRQVCITFSTSHPDISFKYITENNLGLSFARNRGIKEATGSILIFIDDDAIANPDYLKKIWDYFSGDQLAVAGGGKILPLYETSKPVWMSKFLMPLISVLDLGEEIRFFPKKKFPIGANMFFRKEVFDNYKPFNTELGRKGEGMLGGEEKEIFLRIKKSDEKIIYLPGAWVQHFISSERLTRSFIEKQAVGIGKSEMINYRTAGRSVIYPCLNELIKWAASFALFFIYLLSLRPEKGFMIVKFRYFVSYGMLSKQKNDS